MSVKKPPNAERDRGSSFRTALRCILASSALFIASDTATPDYFPQDTPFQEGLYDYLFEGINILPKGSPKIPREDGDSEKGDESHGSDSEGYDFRIPEDSQFG